MHSRLLAVFVGIVLFLGSALVQAFPAEALSASGKTSFIASMVSAAQGAQRKFGVPASVSIAQAIVASGWGASAVVKRANNYFDTPCRGSAKPPQYASLADAQVGKPYVLGANGPKAFDCSSLVIWLNNQTGAFRMGDDTAAGLYNRSRAVVGSPRVGDMVFLRNNPTRSNGIGHMAVLTQELPGGDWRIIEARGRAYGVVRSTLGYWRVRPYYAGLRRLANLVVPKSTGSALDAAGLYQTGCVTIGPASYARFPSMANSFLGHAAAVAKDSAYKAARADIENVPSYVDAIAKIEHPTDAASYARTINSLIGTYNLTAYDVTSFDVVLLSGDKGAKVTALQHLLVAGGARVKTTGTFDAATVSAVEDYQAANGLDKDGEAGPVTLTSLFATVANGATGHRVKALHAILGSLGQATTPGSTFGRDTLASIKDLQSTAGHDDTGIVDSNTWRLLFKTPDQAPAPSVSGSAQVNQTLRAASGEWGPGSFALAFQWYRGGTSIADATTDTYTLQPADAGALVTVSVTGARRGGTRISRVSAPTAPVAKALLGAAPSPAIAGKAIVGESLSAVAGAWSPDPVTLSYQWYRGATAILGETSDTYAVQAADLHAKLKVVVAGTKPGYETVAIGSDGTDAVVEGVVSAKIPTISGTRSVGKTLTALPGSWSPAGVRLTYQWYRGSARIDGAIKQTYTLVRADKAKKITVRVRATLEGYATVEKASAPTRIG